LFHFPSWGVAKW